MKTGTKIDKLTNVAFFQAAELLRTHREEIVKTCRMKRDVVAFLGAKGIACTVSGVASVMDAIGLKLDTPPAVLVGVRTANNQRVIVDALANLYAIAGAPPPKDLTDLQARIRHQQTVNGDGK